MEKVSVEKLLSSNEYPGRGIIAGLSENGKYAVSAYFIMGRSSNSRNRVFVPEGEDMRTKAFDESLLEDPSLIIYYPVRRLEKSMIVTNGDQTDTVRDALLAGSTFESALRTRTFEPDAPNFTPRISALMNFDGEYSYKMSILKACDEKGSGADRFFWEYTPVSGVGHFIHTYKHNGNPIPSFEGEPEVVSIPDSIDEFTDAIWNSLNEDNKISLFVRYIDLVSGESDTKIINKNN